MNINTAELFAPVYNRAFKSIMNHTKERWTFTGGRASWGTLQNVWMSNQGVSCLNLRCNFNCIIPETERANIAQIQQEPAPFCI